MWLIKWIPGYHDRSGMMTDRMPRARASPFITARAVHFVMCVVRSSFMFRYRKPHRRHALVRTNTHE